MQVELALSKRQRTEVKGHHDKSKSLSDEFKGYGDESKGHGNEDHDKAVVSGNPFRFEESVYIYI